jgi:P27 family predicted phage terminase small subunit
MRGRKPKPSHLKLIDGNPGHRPINQDEPEPDADLLPADCPEWLCARAQYHFRRALDNAPAGMIKRLDEGMLIDWANARATIETADRKIREAGEVIKMPGPSGAFMQNPFVSIRNQAQQTAQRLGTELGFSPSSRSRVKVKGKKKGKSAFGKLRELALD